MSSSLPVLLIVDYNLSRISEVFQMRRYAQTRWGAETWLIRSNPQSADLSISDVLFDIDPLSSSFVEDALACLGDKAGRITAGLVFSDNAVASGAALLERLGLTVDNAELALAAFDKYVYRTFESAKRDVLEPLGVLVPDFCKVRQIDDLLGFAQRNAQGFVVKPTCEGNNRGVVVVREGDDASKALDEVAAYIDNGVLAEQLIPYRREFSYDGLGSLAFITEKMSAEGRYPVEVAQVLPARLTDRERQTLLTTGEQINLLIGQRQGPFHNEIKLSDDGTRAAVVEPNRRPAGMKIWTLAEQVYGMNLFQVWIDSVFGVPVPKTLDAPQRSAATVMLGVHQDIDFSPHDIPNDQHPFTRALQKTAALHHLETTGLSALEFTWQSQGSRLIRQVPRDNSDFAAQVCIVLNAPHVDIRDVVLTLREQWLIAFADSLAGNEQQRIAS